MRRAATAPLPPSAAAPSMRRAADLPDERPAVPTPSFYLPPRPRIIGNRGCETGMFLRSTRARGANLGSGASDAMRLWISCGRSVDDLWMAVDRNNLIVLTGPCGEKAYYWISIHANEQKKRARQGPFYESGKVTARPAPRR